MADDASSASFPLALTEAFFLYKVDNFRYSLFFYRDRSRGLASDDGHITIKILADTERSGGSSNIYILEVRQQQYLPNTVNMSCAAVQEQYLHCHCEYCCAFLTCWLYDRRGQGAEGPGTW